MILRLRLEWGARLSTGFGGGSYTGISYPLRGYQAKPGGKANEHHTVSDWRLYLVEARQEAGKETKEVEYVENERGKESTEGFRA